MAAAVLASAATAASIKFCKQTRVRAFFNMEIKLAVLSTDFNALALVTQFTKFLLYQKQQIPFSYDKLYAAVKIKKKRSEKVSERLRLNPSEKLFKLAEKLVETLEEIFLKTSTEFANDQILVSEVVLLLGGSLLSPQQVYRLHFPSFELGHLPKHHSGQLIMNEVLKVIVESDELNKMFEKPVAPTNLFLLLRIRGQPHCTKWLLPKPRYNIPNMGQQINMHFKFEAADRVACSCKGFNFFSDVSVENIALSESFTEPCSHPLADLPAIWYQVPLIVKGFSDIFIRNISVSKDWLTCS